MRTTTNEAANIRQTLKAKHGWTSRDVSVKSEYYSMGSSIYVTIKNPSVPLETVKAIAEQSERIDRDEFTGEILSGGNRFVNVHYSREALDALAAGKADDVRRAVVELKQASDNILIPIEGTEYLIGKGNHGYGFSIWDHDTHRAEVMDEHSAAAWVAIGSHNQ